MAEQEKASSSGKQAPAPKGAGAKAGGEGSAPEAKLDDFLAAAYRVGVLLNDAELFSKNGISAEEWSFLKALGTEGGTAFGEAARHSGLPRARLRTVMSELESKKLIAVAREEGSTRVATVTLLQKGGETVGGIARDLEGMAQNNPSLKESNGKRLAVGMRTAAKFVSAMQRATRNEARAEREGAEPRAAERTVAPRKAEKKTAEAPGRKTGN